MSSLSFPLWKNPGAFTFSPLLTLGQCVEAISGLTGSCPGPRMLPTTVPGMPHPSTSGPAHLCGGLPGSFYHTRDHVWTPTLLLDNTKGISEPSLASHTSIPHRYQLQLFLRLFFQLVPPHVSHVRMVLDSSWARYCWRYYQPQKTDVLNEGERKGSMWEPRGHTAALWPQKSKIEPVLLRVLFHSVLTEGGTVALVTVSRRQWLLPHAMWGK